MAKDAATAKPPAAMRRAAVLEHTELGLLSDLYSEMLGLPLIGLIGLMALLFITANLVFAGLYLVDPAGAPPEMKGFADAFFYSVQTIANVNLGFGAPRDLYARWVVTAEAFVGLLALALATGMFFARIARPTARVIFSRVAVITDFEGGPALMFRAGNRRSNQILQTEVMVNLAHNVVTADGHTIRRFEELELVKARAPLFAFTWTLIHRIGPESPLAGFTTERLIAASAEILVVLTGLDDRFAQSVFARCSFTPDEIRFGHRLVDVLSNGPDGRWRVDFKRFHDTAPA